ncbi:hypothetical protein GCM10027174_23800 [Salinifilum aidingensis]
MRVVLARRRRPTNGGRPPAVHAYRVPEQDGPAVPLWRAACGDEIAPHDAEVVPRFVGAPCSTCMLAALGEDGADAAVGTSTRSKLTTYPARARISPTGRYATALWGEHTIHFVAPDAPEGQLDGYRVVQALCGHLGWGPLAPDSVPRGWPTCEECLHAAPRSPRVLPTS